MKNKLKLFCLMSTFLLVSCSDVTSNKNYAKLLFRSPYGCSHTLIFNESGIGKIVAGEENEYSKDFTVFESIIRDEVFSIKKEDDLKSIHKIINDLEGKKLYTTSRPKDAFHYELYIAGEKKIDAYGRKSEVFNNLSEILSKHYPFEIDYTCEKYISN